MRLIDRVRERRLRRCKPSAAFVEDEGKLGGEDAIAVVTVQRRRWPVAVFLSLAAPPLDRLGFRDYRWGV